MAPACGFLKSLPTRSVLRYLDPSSASPSARIILSTRSKSSADAMRPPLTIGLFDTTGRDGEGWVVYTQSSLSPSGVRKYLSKRSLHPIPALSSAMSANKWVCDPA